MEKVISFLKALKSHNNKEWFDSHKDKYLEAREEFEALTSKIVKGVQKFDKEVSPSLQAKDCMFRIYRDVRFSKDKTPYKTFMSAEISPGGKKAEIPGYYFQVGPGHSLIAGGCYTPQPDQLMAIRQEIDYNGDRLEKILKSKTFTKYFDGLDESEKLKTVPKGFDKDNKRIELLKLKSFLVHQPLEEKYLKSKDLDKKILENFKAMHPLLRFLREAIEK